MKKIFLFISAIFLSVVLSCTCVNPNAFNIKAENNDLVTSIDFDYEGTGNYSYFRGEDDQTNKPAFKEIESGEYCYAQYLTRSLASASRPHRGYVIRDSFSEDNAPLKLTNKVSYVISLEIKPVKITTATTVAICWVPDPNKISTSFNPDDYKMNVLTTLPATTNGNIWYDVCEEITPASVSYLYPILVAYVSGLNKTETIYYDNITIKKGTKSSNELTNVDFTEEGKGNYPYYFSEGDQTNYPDFKKLDNENYVYTQYLTRSITDRPHRGYLIRNSYSSNNNPLALIYGNNYNISFKFKNVNSSLPTTLAIFWISNPETVKEKYFINDLKKSILAVIPANSEEQDWINITGTISPDTNNRIYPVLIAYSSSLNNKTEKIYYDDIVITKDDGTESSDIVPNLINFENHQENVYSKNNKNCVGSITKSEENNVFKYNKIVSCDESDNAVTAGTLGLCNSDSSTFISYKKGTSLSVTFDLNADELTGLSGKNISVGIIYDNYGKAASLSGLHNAEESGKLLKVTDFNTDSSGWIKLGGKITVPDHAEDEIPWLVFYTEDKVSGISSDKSILIDNIALSNADIDKNGTSDIIDLIKLNKYVLNNSEYNCNYDINANKLNDNLDLVYYTQVLLN